MILKLQCIGFLLDANAVQSLFLLETNSSCDLCTKVIIFPYFRVRDKHSGEEKKFRNALQGVILMKYVKALHMRIPAVKVGGNNSWNP